MSDLLITTLKALNSTHVRCESSLCSLKTREMLKSHFEVTLFFHLLRVVAKYYPCVTLKWCYFWLCPLFQEAVLLPDKIATEQQSVVLVKRLLAISVSCITYMRGLFPESSYGTRYLDGNAFNLC